MRDVVARAARVAPASLDLGRWLPELGVDSLGMLVVRETLERDLGIHITDDAWLRFRSLGDVLAYAGARAASPGEVRAAAAGRPAMPEAPPPTRGLGRDGRYREELEIGMPMTGRNNLAEGPLLQQVGHVRWQHMSAVCGAPSREIVDEEGNRLYATFFFIDLAFPAERPMAAFGENDRLRIITSLRRFGESMLDGVALVAPADGPEPGPEANASVEAALGRGIPAVRMSNIFVRQFAGAEWLKKSRPSNPGFQRIAEVATVPESLALAKQAEAASRFSVEGRTLLPLLPEPARVEYALVPDRDLNGAGLVYFAHYPVFVDIAERQVLGGPGIAMPQDLVDRRTLVRRRSAYLNNAGAHDRLLIQVEPCLEVPDGDALTLALAPLRFVVHTRMSRMSDGRTMYVSTAEKVVTGRLIEDWPGAADLFRGAVSG